MNYHVGTNLKTSSASLTRHWRVFGVRVQCTYPPPMQPLDDEQRTRDTFRTFRTNADRRFQGTKHTRAGLAQRRPSGVELAGTVAMKKIIKSIIKQYYRETKTKSLVSLRCRMCHYHGRRHIATTFRCPPHQREIIKTSRKITARLINTNTQERS